MQVLPRYRYNTLFGYATVMSFHVLHSSTVQFSVIEHWMDNMTIRLVCVAWQLFSVLTNAMIFYYFCQVCFYFMLWRGKSTHRIESENNM